jgi:hypothetical protein
LTAIVQCFSSGRFVPHQGNSHSNSPPNHSYAVDGYVWAVAATSVHPTVSRLQLQQPTMDLDDDHSVVSLPIPVGQPAVAATSVHRTISDLHLQQPTMDLDDDHSVVSLPIPVGQPAVAATSVHRTMSDLHLQQPTMDLDDDHSVVSLPVPVEQPAVAATSVHPTVSRLHLQQPTIDCTLTHSTVSHLAHCERSPFNDVAFGVLFTANSASLMQRADQSDEELAEFTDAVISSSKFYVKITFGFANSPCCFLSSSVIEEHCW